MAPQDEFLTIRIDPDLKSALQAAADREGRSVSNFLKLLIRQHCVGDGIPNVIRSPVTTSYRPGRPAKRKK